MIPARSIRQCARFSIVHQAGQFADVAGAATRHEAKFGKMTAHRVDQLCALAQQQCPGSVQHHRRLLLDRLDRDKTHVRSDHGFADAFGIGRVVLVGLDERADVLRRDQPDVMAETLQLARPVMAARAGLNADQRPRKASKEHHDLGAAKLATQHAPSLSIGAVHLKHILRDIETDDGRIGHFSSSRLLPPSLGIAPTAATGVKGGPCHHARRKFYDVFASTRSPIAEEALKRIGELYRIEAEVTGQPAGIRLAARQNRAVAILDALRDWLTAQRRRLSSKNALAKAIQYALSRWEALARYAGDGRLAIDNNVAGRALRGIAITRESFLFLGSEAGGERAAILYTVLESAKLNGLDPEGYLADVIDRMTTGHPINRLAELLPWNWRGQPAKLAA